LIKLAVTLDAIKPLAEPGEELARHAKSPRSREVLLRIAGGSTIHEVAVALGYSEGTIKADGRGAGIGDN
jgi:DNA-binding NarL/FixJ family response regulator